MSVDILDMSYYNQAGTGNNSGSSASGAILDVPLSNGQIVSLNLDEELPNDALELVSFLELENCASKYWISVAQGYCFKNKNEEALKLITEALKLSMFNEDDGVKFHGFLSWLYLKLANESDKRGNLGKAFDEIEHVSRINPSNVSNLLAKAIYNLNSDGPVEKSLEIFDKLLKIDSTNCFALLGKAQIILKRTKNYTSALKIYQQVLLINPTMKPDPRIGIGMCFWLLKDEKMAITSWERSLELDPQSNNTKAKILLNLAKFNKVFNKSLSDEEFINSYESALTELSSLHKESPKDSIILMALVPYYFSKGQYDIVLKICDSIINNIAVNPAKKITKFQSILLSSISLWLGRVSYAESDFTKAQKHFHESIKLNDQNLLAKLGLGQSQISRGLIEEAIITFESILKTDLKCLEVVYSLGILYSKQKGRRKQEASIAMLERYLRLCNKELVIENSISGNTINTGSNKDADGSTGEPAILNALLTLSKLYEAKDINQSLAYLNKAIQSRKTIGKDAPLEVYNNIGVIHFNKNNYQSSTQFFETSQSKLEELSDEARDELSVTLSFNIARSKEISNELEAVEIYNKLLEECPSYFSAKIRLLFLNCLNPDSSKEEVKEEIETLLNENLSNLEIRSFYGWFIKTFGKKLSIKSDIDTVFQKNTLVEYDSHDCYALISLANIYCIMARDIKAQSSPQNEEKRKKYYIRAIELFSKVLSVDPKDVYAAQGLAIIYIENKEFEKGLEILRKIRDSLNDISVYLNLAHVLIETRQFTKAIENYEIALHRFGGRDKVKILTLLGRSWYLRGMFEKNMTYLKKSYEYSEEALDEITGNESSGSLASSSLKFNLAYVQFQIAEYVSKLPIDKRNVDDIKDSILGLNEAIKIFNDLSSEEEKFSPYAKEDLRARANIGSQTLLNRLNVCFEETNDYLTKFQHRLDEAKKEREREEEALKKEEEERMAKQKEIEDALAAERAILQEQAQQWAEESRLTVVEDDDNDKDDGFEEDSEEKKKTKKTRASKKENGSSKRGGKKRKSSNIIDDEEEEEPELDDEKSASESEVEDSTEPSRKKARNSKKRIADDEDDDEEDGEEAPKPIAGGRKKKSTLSEEKIVDSDEDLDDDGLFGEDGEAEGEKE